jgi:hypothetical protein
MPDWIRRIEAIAAIVTIAGGSIGIYLVIAPALSARTRSVDDFEHGVDNWYAYSHKGDIPFSVRAATSDAYQGSLAMNWTVRGITSWAIVECVLPNCSVDIDGYRYITFWAKGTGISDVNIELRCPDYDNSYAAMAGVGIGWKLVKKRLPSLEFPGDFDRTGNPKLDSCHVAFTNNANDTYLFDDLRLEGISVWEALAENIAPVLVTVIGLVAFTFLLVRRRRTRGK